MRQSTRHRTAIATAAAVMAALLAAPAGASAGSGVINGTVTDDEEGEAIAGARVATSRTRGGALDIETRTDAEGTYKIEGLDPGFYDVAFFPPEGSNFVMEWSGDSWDWGSSRSVRVVEGEAVFASADLSVGGTISGRVTTKSGGGAARACVNALTLENGTGSLTSRGRATTDSVGNYRITGLAPGAYKMWFGPVEAPHGKCDGGARNSGFEATWLGGGADFFDTAGTKVMSEEDRQGIDAVIGTGKDEASPGAGTPPTPGSQRARCVVPKLRGMGLVAAKKALSAARCKLGKRTRRADPEGQAWPSHRLQAEDGRLAASWHEGRRGDQQGPRRGLSGTGLSTAASCTRHAESLLSGTRHRTTAARRPRGRKRQRHYRQGHRRDLR